MRLFFAILSLAAAAVIVGYSGVTLFWAGYDSVADPWQKPLAGIGIAAIVAWEAGALLLILYCWRNGERMIALGAAVLLVLAMAVTLSMEMRLHIGGQADKAAQRQLAATRLAGLQRDADLARQRIEALTKEARSPAQRAELDKAYARLREAESALRTAPVTAGGMPQAAWAARITDTSELFWQDVLIALPLLFWTLARVFSVPLAIAALSPRRTPPAALASPAPVTDDTPQPKRQDSPAPAGNVVPLRQSQGVDDSRVLQEWASRHLATSKTPVAHAKLYEHYRAFCTQRQVKPLPEQMHGKELNALGYRSFKLNGRKHYNYTFGEAYHDTRAVA